MTITFHCPDAPTRPAPANPDYPEVVFEESTLPTLELSQANGHALLRLMQLTEQSEGTVEVSTIPAVLQRLLTVVNSTRTRSPELVPYRNTKLPGKARVVEQAHGDEYFQTKAKQLLDIFSAAQKHQVNVVWY